jgi:hypothetical protein
VKPLPVITTCVPTWPLDGLKLIRVGTTLNDLLLMRLPVVVVTVTRPLTALVGTVAVR